MKKKVMWFVGVAFLVCCVIYFYPMSFPSNLIENQDLTIQVNELGVQNGEAYINTKKYDQITEEQKRKIVERMQNCSYKRTLKTYMGDGAMEELGNKIAFISIYDGETLTEIAVSDSGQVSIHGRLYEMRNAEQFIRGIEDVLK